MVLGCQEVVYKGSPPRGGNEDCGRQGLAREGNYLFGCLASLLGCLAGLLVGLLGRWQAWKLAIWLAHSKYHGSWLPRGGL